MDTLLILCNKVPSKTSVSRRRKETKEHVDVVQVKIAKEERNALHMDKNVQSVRK